MKKIYSILTLFVASLLGLAAQAETRTVTFHVDDPSRLQPLEMYGSDVTIAFGDDNTAQVTFGEESGTRQVNITAADGCKIISVKNADGSEFKSSYTLYPTPSSTYPATKVEFAGYYDDFNIEDGDVINIETIEVQSKIFTFKANPEHIKYAYVGSKQIYMDETGVLDINVTDVYTVYIYFDDDCTYKSATNEAGETQTFTYNKSNNNISIKPGDYEGNQTFNLITASKEDLRTATLNVSIVNGTASDVDFYRGGKIVTLDGTESVVKFDPEGEAEFKLSRNPWTKNLFKVELDGETKEYSGYYINFSPKDGSNLVITVDQPISDVDVPVTFNFTNPGTEDALQGLQVVGGAYYTAEECLFEGFSLKLGSEFAVMCNEDVYDVDVYYNGQDSYTGKISTEGEYVVTITATKIPTQDITVKCEAWEHISLFDDSGDPIVLTSNETIISFKYLPYYIEIATKDGYVLNSVINEATEKDILEIGYYGDYKVRDLEVNMTMIIDASEFVRDQEMIMYLEDIEWKRQEISLSDYTDVELRKNLDPGYNHVMFGNGDFPNTIFHTYPLDGDVVMYLNDEKITIYEDWYGGWASSDLSDVKAGDVLKIFAEEKTPHQVTYQVAEDVNADIFHDHIVAVAEPATHSVLPGTEIHIKPAAAKTRSAVSGLIVKVNDETVEPAADGVYTITADGDKTISVTNDPSTSIVEISADGKVKAYDLMGRKVNANHRGLTIINGKKVMK